MKIKYIYSTNKILILLLAVIMCGSCKSKSEKNPSEKLHQIILGNDLSRPTLLAANRLADSLILKNKEDGSLYLRKGEIEMYLGNFTVAKRCYQKAYQLNFERDVCIRLLVNVDFMIKYGTPDNNKKDTVLF